MEVIKGIAWFCVFVLGVFGFGTLATLSGGPWITAAAVWMGFWIAVAIAAEIASPSRWN